MSQPLFDLRSDTSARQINNRLVPAAVVHLQKRRSPSACQLRVVKRNVVNCVHAKLRVFIYRLYIFIYCVDLRGWTNLRSCARLDILDRVTRTSKARVYISVSEN